MQGENMVKDYRLLETGKGPDARMAFKRSQRIEAQVVEAIRRLQAIQGSTPQEISNYIAQEYNIPGSEIRPHVQLALKRGVTYGILQRLKGGCYTYNPDFLNGQCISGGDATVEIPCKGRRRRRGRSRRRGRRRRAGRSRRRSRRRKTSRRRRSSSRRRRRGRRRRREEFPKEIDGLDLTKQPTKSSSLLTKDSPQSNHSISENSEGKQE
ncbi:histone H1, gonadal-like [Apis cerana]|uniref:histone H1, gonadal-like n=1 Tax=Apis cerana TaxID=7461 RepID=UPI0007E2BE62|nr:histone H1, gonadal-like [Apis cerana]